MTFVKLIVIAGEGFSNTQKISAGLSRIGRTDFEICQIDDVLRLLDRSPIIAFRGKNEGVDYPQPNHIEFIDVVFDEKAADFEKPAIRLGNCTAGELTDNILKAEQRVLQRIKFVSSSVNSIFYDRFNLVGTSSLFEKVTHNICRVASTDSRVLIHGETGTGKESAAQAIHYLSSRTDKPFIPVNCGAFSDELLLSELFGHKKGAFTGALENRPGLIQSADGGTLFLDEVDTLSTRAQVALLRFLQENEIRPIGSQKAISVDVRVVAASNKHLSKLVEAGLFRDDLLYRLDVLKISLPPLRRRGDDVFLVAQTMLSKISAELERPPKVLGGDAIAYLMTHKWPGNFRELESALLRAYLMTNDEVIADPSLLCTDVSTDELPDLFELGSFSREKNTIVRKFERDYIKKVLSETNGNVSRAAGIAKKERRAFTRLMEKHDINRSDFMAARTG